MKIVRKVFMGLAAFLILSGGLLAISGFVMGAERSIDRPWRGGTLHMTPFSFFSSIRSVESIDPNDSNPGGVSDLALSPFASLDLDVDLADITVKEGPYGVALTWSRGSGRLYYEVDDGVLRVWSGDDSFPNTMGFAASATVYCPAGTKFEDVTVRSGLGAVNLSGFTTRSLIVDASLGAVDIRKVSTGSADLTLSLGDLKAKELSVSGTTYLSNELGSSSLQGTFGAMELTNSLGDLTVSTTRPKAEYSWDLSAELGDVTLDGKGQDGWDQHLTGGSGDRHISAQCEMGSLSVTFGG